MKTKTIAAIVLITLGVIVLAYSGMTFTSPEGAGSFLGVHVETTISQFISPFIGAFALVGGAVLLLLDRKTA